MSDNQILAAVFFFAVIFLYRRQRAFLTLLKYPMRPAEPARVERSTMPLQTAQLLDGARQELEAAGFRYEFTHAAAPLNELDPRPLAFADMYWNPEKSTLASVRLAEPHTGQAVSFFFVTALADGKKLATTNRIAWSVFPALDEYIRQDAYASNFFDQWKFHLDALEKESARRGVITDLDQVLQLEQGGMSRLFAHLQSIGWVREESPGRFRFTAKGAWKYARQQLRGAREARASLTQPYQHTFTPDPEALRNAEMNTFATSIELAAQPMPQWMKAVMFGLTLLASVILFGREISFVSAIALLLVLLVHEFGHLLAMRAFGFRNLTILFLPFFGAVATGHKTHVKPWQEAIILLAGPVPGLIAALALSQVPLAGMSPHAAEFVRMTFWFALLINLFNLLPISILDGGKLFQLAVLSRFPHVRVVFAAVGTAIALVYAVTKGSVVLAMAMAFVLMSMGHQYRGAKAIAAIRARAKAQGTTPGHAQLGKEEAIAMLAQHLARPEFNEASARGWLKRTAIANVAYPRLLQGVPPLGTSLGVMAAHSAAFFAPLLVAAWLVQQPGGAPVLRTGAVASDDSRKHATDEAASAARAQFMARYSALSDPQEKWSMLNEQDDEDAAFTLDEKWEWQEREALFPALPADHPAKLERILAQVSRDDPQATELILSVVAQLTRGNGAQIANLDEPRFFIVMHAFDDLQKHAAPETLAAQNGMLEAAWVKMESPAPENSDWRRRWLAGTAAHLAFAGGDPARAEMWMARKASCGCKSNDSADVDQAWFQLDLGRADQAQNLALRALSAPGVKTYLRDEWLALAGWVEMSRGRAREADEYFMQALRGEDSRRQDDFDVIAWLLRLIQGTPSQPRWEPPIRSAMLDHLAALEGYDSREAARYRAELAGKMTPQWVGYVENYLVPNQGSGGWGRERTATLARVVSAMQAGGTVRD